MKQCDVRLGGANKGPEADDHGRRLPAGRRVEGTVLLAASVLLIFAGFIGPRTSAASSGDRAEGAAIFKQNGCEHCHGVDGAGSDKGPSLATVGKRMKKDQIEHQIRDGGKQMPPFQDVLNDDDIRKLVDYLAHKKKAPKPQPGS